MPKRALKPREFYGSPLPGVDATNMRGHLIVVEGADGSGRSTQVALLRDWLESEGYPTVEVGLKRSGLVGKELTEVMKGHTLNPVTLFLYYATDFADELENIMVPALRSDFVVLADRYIYTLMARDIVRGADPAWLRDLYSFALIPDAVFSLKVDPRTLAERSLRKNSALDYWESGMDIRRDGDMYACFTWYQGQVRQVFEDMQSRYNFIPVDGDRPPKVVFKEIRDQLDDILKDRRKDSE